MVVGIREAIDVGLSESLIVGTWKVPAQGSTQEARLMAEMKTDHLF